MYYTLLREEAAAHRLDMKQHPDTNQDFIAHRREIDGASQSLWQHLLETSTLAGRFAAKISLREQGELLGLLHDLGKATWEFARYIGSKTGLIDPDESDYVDAHRLKGKIDHSSAGAQVIFRRLSAGGKANMVAAQVLALTIASHHSGLIDCLTPEGEDSFSRRMEKPDEMTRTSEALANLSNEIRKKMDRLLSDPGLVQSFNDTLKLLQESSDSRETMMFKIGLLTRFLFSCLIDADRLSTADFELPDLAMLRSQGDYVQWSVLINRLEQHLAGLEVRGKVDVLRQDISKRCLEFATRPKGLYQLTVPTGGGKTLSSLRFALHHAKQHGMERVIYIIPYTSIIDQNAETVRRILEPETGPGADLGTIVLENHSNLTAEKETPRQKLLAENWDAPVVFTTMVQFLEALFGHGTRSARRMHQLANAVLIFDEVQTLPVKCVHLFNVAIRFLIKMCGSSVILCTATQPLLDRVEPPTRELKIGPDQQMMPDTQKLFKELKRVQVYDRRKDGGWRGQEVADLVEDELHETGSVLVIVNTKRAARELFERLNNHTAVHVYHLSTNMCPAHRLRNLAEIKACLPDQKPVICVSTQLIEAGVDIDFGSVIRYLAGLDSIAQAAGRCNRNGARPRPGRVLIVNPAEENLDRLRDIRIGKECAERVLREFESDPDQFDGDILGPKAMERYYEYYFYRRSDEMAYPVSSSSPVGRADRLFDLLSTNPSSVEAYRRIHGQSNPQIPLRQSFMSAAQTFAAIDAFTRGVIVPYGAEGRRIIEALCSLNTVEDQYRLLREAQRYSVNVHANKFNDLAQRGVIREVQPGLGIFYLDERYYSADFGLSEDEVSEMETLIS